MDRDNPFASDADAGKTVIRPRPGGRAPAPASGSTTGPSPLPVQPEPAGAPAPLPRDAARLEFALTGVNPLVTAAAPLLALATRIRSTARVGDVEGLRERTIREFRDFEARVGQIGGISADTYREARYALAATIDDLAQNTPWGGHDAWAGKSMVNVFHRETFGGERFFELLDRVRGDPARNLDLLELMYLCVALGFEGRYRLASRGASELSRIREEVYRAIRNQRGEFERALSPHWQGIPAAHAPLGRFLPVWVMALACAGLMLLAYAGFLFLLVGAREPALAALGELNMQSEIRRPPAPRAPAPVVVQPPPVLDRLRTFLKPEIDARLVEVLPDGNSAKIRILDAGMFASGSADVQPAFQNLLNRIGEALRDEDGRVFVTGHTDNVPIRRSLRFPSNLELSIGRAEAVAGSLAARLGGRNRLTSEGRADTEALASNDTPEGRARNRRVEIQLIR